MVTLETPEVAGLGPVFQALREWQDDAVTVQLHPGDVGWYLRHGPEAAARAMRVWRRDGRIDAIAQLDGPDLLRVTMAPGLMQDRELARRVVDDIADADSGVLTAGGGNVEAPRGSAVRELLLAEGWTPAQEWVPLQRFLQEPIEATDITIEVAGPAAVASPVPPGSTATAANRWRSLARAIPYPDARCLIGHNAAGEEVAVVTVWSAGPGRPGLVLPLGVESGHRGHGYGRAMVLAGLAALRELGSSSALALVEATNVGAGRTYMSAGFVPGEILADVARI